MKNGNRNNGNLDGSFSDSFDETKNHFEQVSDEELSYIKETQSSIISGRKWYSWNKGSANNAPLASPAHVQPETISSHSTSPQYHSTLNETVAQSPDLKNIFQEDFAKQEFSGDENDPSGEPEEYYLGDSDDDENGLSLLSTDKAEDTDPELIELTIIDDDYADREESKKDHYLDSHSDIQDDSSTSTAFDWRGVDTDEFEEGVSQYEDIEVETDGKVSRRARAFQIALGIGEKFDLERDEIEFLTELFYESGWSATKTSILQALNRNATIEELRLAYDLKLFWKEHPEFTSGYSQQYDILSWPTALVIIRSFGSYPDIVEAESLLFYIFECWEANLTLQRTFRVFGYYLYYRFGCIDRTLDIMPEWTFEADHLISHDWLTPPSSLDIPNLTEFKSEKQLCKTRLKYAEN